jgi:methyltransferase-like protein/2-polyprenyl-3-methyl-5-hydroxy-6-metoxy-1,4-benzoquinol methylase
MNEQANSYDLVPYESHPFRHTHPNHLATIGILSGMRPAPVTHCRVLELGCAAGGNLIPMAVQFPDSRFVGVDLSAREVAEGVVTIERLGLNNIEIRHANILEIDEAFGNFDYIIAHGVFSWVPPEIQDGMFRIIAQRLNPHGIAFISYNCNPGWYMRGLVRDMMRYHALNFSSHKIQTRQARVLLDFLASSVAKDGNAYSGLLRQEVEFLRHHSDDYLFHEHLEALNIPLFFHQFMEKAGAHRLQYLAEANIRTMMASNLPDGVEKALRVMATDQVQMEQYMDFLRNRSFRETLLCHEPIRVVREFTTEPIRRLWVASTLEAPGSSPIHTEEPLTFRTPEGSLTTKVPLMKAAYTCLRQAWPQSLSFEQLFDKATDMLRATHFQKWTADDRGVLASRLMSTYLSSDLIRLHAAPQPFVTFLSERPVACPLARRQSGSGMKVTNRRHEVVGLNPVQQALLPALDGTRSRADLLTLLTERTVRDHLHLRAATEQPEGTKAGIAKALDNTLQEFVTWSLLVG